MYHIVKYIQQQKSLNKSLLSVSLMLFFWAIFDGSVSFISPLVAENLSDSKTLLGILIGTSSFSGIVFDMLFCYFVKNTNFRRIFLVMLILCFAQPLLLWQADTIYIFILAMASWGLYYDLFGIGSMDFVGRATQKEAHSSSFGVIRSFYSLGYLLAPLLVGFLVQDEINFDVFLMMWVFISLAFVFYLVLMIVSKGEKDKIADDDAPRRNFLAEVKVWKKVGSFIWPVLGLSLMLNMIDAFFWTIGPLASEEFLELGKFKGLFLLSYLLPPLFVGWLVGSVTKKFGKKRTALLSILIGSMVLIALPITGHSYATILVVFIAAFFISFSWPAINGAYADYVSESAMVEKEIESLVDFFTNLGFIIGPIAAGMIADALGNINTFAILGLIAASVSLFLILVTPKEINIRA